MVDRDRSTTTTKPPDGIRTSDTMTILANVSWIVEQLDGRALAEMAAVPILELAKHISINRRAA